MGFTNFFSILMNIWVDFDGFDMDFLYGFMYCNMDLIWI
jgi:hypothetical protein